MKTDQEYIKRLLQDFHPSKYADSKMKTDQERIKEYANALLDIAEILDVESEIGPQHIVNAVHDLRAQLSAFELLKAEHAELIACNKTGAERLQFVLRENIRLRKALQSVLRYRRGQGEYDFSCEPEETRSNAAFDAWMQIEDHIISLLPNAQAEGAEAGRPAS
jgi:hypothetical protein